MLNFWASWCYPCNQEAPTLQAACEALSESASSCSASTSTTSTSDARKFARKFKLTYPLVHDNHNITSPKYGLTGLPETFFIDRNGKLVGARGGGDQRHRPA